MKRDKATLMFDLLSPVYDMMISGFCRLRGGRSYEDRIRREILGQIDIKPHHRLLDIGIGTGINLTYLQKQPLQITGVDPSFGMLRQCARRFIKLGIQAELFCHTAEQLFFADETYDRILCVNVFMYVSSCDAVLKEMLRVLTPAGKLVLTVHSRWLAKQDPFLFQQTYREISVTAAKQGLISIITIQKIAGT